MHHVTTLLHDLATTKNGFKAGLSLWRPAVFFWEEVTLKPAVLNSPPLLRWFYRQAKNHTAIHCIGVYNGMLFTDGCAVLSEWERDAQLQKQKINMWPKLILWRTATNKWMCWKHCNGGKWCQLSLSHESRCGDSWGCGSWPIPVSTGLNVSATKKGHYGTLFSCLHFGHSCGWRKVVHLPKYPPNFKDELIRNLYSLVIISQQFIR